MTSDTLKVAQILALTTGLGVAFVIAGAARHAHGKAPSREVISYDNDGRQFARVAPAQKAGHRKRAGRVHRAAGHRKPGRSVSLAGVVPELALKVRSIVSDCGSTVVSAVAGRGNKSNHPRGRAVDLTGNPGCIYKHLEAWPGGVSTDYATVMCPTRTGWIHCPHVHVSYNPGGQEWGRRFAHRNPFIRPKLARALAQEAHRN